MLPVIANLDVDLVNNNTIKVTFDANINKYSLINEDKLKLSYPEFTGMIAHAAAKAMADQYPNDLSTLRTNIPHTEITMQSDLMGDEFLSYTMLFVYPVGEGSDIHQYFLDDLDKVSSSMNAHFDKSLYIFSSAYTNEKIVALKKVIDKVACDLVPWNMFTDAESKIVTDIKLDIKATEKAINSILNTDISNDPFGAKKLLFRVACISCGLDPHKHFTFE